MNGISESGIVIKPVGANHLFLNFMERQVQVWKRLLSSMRQDQGKSVYDQKQTTMQLKSELSQCERSISLRPILKKYIDQEEKVLIAVSIGEPSMNGEVLNQTMSDLMSGVAGTLSWLFQEIMEGNAAVMSQFRGQLLMYLQEESVSYKDTRKDNSGKQTTEGLKPKLNDFVTN